MKKKSFKLIFSVLSSSKYYYDKKKKKPQEKNNFSLHFLTFSFHLSPQDVIYSRVNAILSSTVLKLARDFYVTLVCLRRTNSHYLLSPTLDSTLLCDKV